MALYTIGDLHLSLAGDKLMDKFGETWQNHPDKLRQGFSALGEEDLTVLCGDLSWAMSMQEAEADFRFIQELPGKKLILKGNHDYWWTTAAKFYRFCAENGWDDIFLLHNNCYEYGGFALCGTRGWFYEEDKEGTHDEKVFRRELIRLETSLKAAGELPRLCFLHYPPRYRGYTCPEILALLKQYRVAACYYGHLHSDSHKLAVEGDFDGTHFQLLSADYINFTPVKLLD